MRDAKISQITENEEIQNLIKIIGLQANKKYTDRKSLRYGSVMIMADQDHDGSHFKGLIINFIHNFWPELLKMRGFLSQFITPIIKATKDAQMKMFFTVQEFKRWFEQMNSQLKGWKIKYYRGLGSNTKKEGEDYFHAIEKHRIDFEYVDKDDDDSITMAFSRMMVDVRKDWLSNYDPEVEIDYNQPSIRYQEFVNREMIHFSNYDNVRAIPSICDGLKPSQRKILYSCFKRHLKDEIKVAQLTGYVAEHSAYHHGEQSLAMAIIGLAQTFVGANNINLLQPMGQFGSRNAGGRDSADFKYIYTKLSKVTRYLFAEHDDHLYKYLDDDGQLVEPEWYLPIIPLILVNGADSIGTCWSTNIPCYNPRDIVENIKRKLNGEDFTEMHPWYKGYNGNIDVIQKGYSIRGKYEITSDDTLTITELPIKKWTTDYKTFLEGMMKPDEEEAELKDLKEYHANDRVHFTVQMKEGALAKLGSREAIEKKFKLSTQMQLSNMVLFNSEGKIRRYEKVDDILQEFFSMRLQFYEKRKEYFASELERDIDILANKKRFIIAVIQEDIQIRNVKKKNLIQELVRKNYTPMKNMTKIKSTKLQGVKGEADDVAQAVEEAEEVAAEEGEEGYNYLLSMPIWNLTYEKLEELKRQLENTERELESLRLKKIETMWNDDLDKFMEVLDQVEETQERERLKLPKKKGAEISKKKQKKEKSEDKSNAERPKAHQVSDRGVENIKESKTNEKLGKKSDLSDIVNLRDAKDAGTFASELCTLILMEGYSTQLLDMVSFESMYRDNYGIYSLNEKLQSLKGAEISQIIDNEEVQNLLRIIGLQVNEKYKDTKRLRYGSVMIMADQNSDISHIKDLITNLFSYLWPELLEIKGFLKQSAVPILKATKGNQMKLFFTVEEFKIWLHQTKNNIEDWRINYYKGPGSQLQKTAEYFSVIDNNEVGFYDNELLKEDSGC